MKLLASHSAVCTALVLGLTVSSSLAASNRTPSKRLLFDFFKPAPKLDDAYDYVVIGAGTSGMTLAGRLSERPSVTVGVLEAGIDYESNLINSQLTNIPGADVIGAGGGQSDNAQSGIDWQFVTEPFAGADGRRLKYARGKCIGGSSARNFMLYHRPSRGSQQTWVDLTGDRQWGFYQRIQDYQKTFHAFAPRPQLRKDNPSAQYNPSAFPYNGPVNIGFPNYAQPFSSPLLSSLDEIGVKITNDMSSGRILGAQFSTMTINEADGHRSTSRAFYAQALKRTNIKVATQAQAKKVLFSTPAPGRKPRAVGVVYVDSKGAEHVVKANKEVIISAGAFQSPQLLMLSGIGPAAELQRFNIPVLVNNGHVGQNMEDHAFFGPSYKVKVDTLTKIAGNLLALGAAVAQFDMSNQGPLSNNVADMIAFERFNNTYLSQINAAPLQTYPTDWPNLEYLSAPGYVGNFDNLLSENMKEGSRGDKFATVLMALVSPLSKGSVTLKSADPKQLPAINPNWIAHPVDQVVAIAGFRRARDAFAARAMQSTLAEPGKEYFPGAAVQTDAQILAWIRQNIMTVWHAACTCRMADSPRNGVLDSNMRVFGVDGLRVVDASSFPKLLPGHPQAVCYMIAERAATLILSDYGLA